MQMNVIEEYKTAETEFELFCKVRRWTYAKFRINPKNSSQYLGVCLDEQGVERKFLISQNRRYYELLGDRRFKEIDYVLKKDSEMA